METNVQSKVLAVENDYWWFKVRREILVELTTKFVVPGSRALDLGCGTGFIAQKLIKYYDLSLVDSNKEALDICKDKGLCGINASIHHLPFEDSTFDLVYCFDVLYHRSVQPCERALNEIYRVLNKGGYFIVSEPAFSFLSNLEERTDYAAKRFTKKEIVVNNDPSKLEGLKQPAETQQQSVLGEINFDEPEKQTAGKRRRRKKRKTRRNAGTGI